MYKIIIIYYYYYDFGYCTLDFDTKLLETARVVRKLKNFKILLSIIYKAILDYYSFIIIIYASAVLEIEMVSHKL